MWTAENRKRYDRSKLALSERSDRRGMGAGRAADTARQARRQQAPR